MGIVIIILFAIIGVAIYTGVQKNKRESSINNLENNLNGGSFKSDKKVVNIDSTFSLFVDNRNKKWMIYDVYSNYKQTMNFEDLLSFELVEDNESLVKGRAGSAVVGGLLFGGLGALAGASRSRKIKGVCNNMQINVIVNNLNCPNITIPLIINQTKKDSFIYKESFKNAQEFVGVLKYIMANSKTLLCEN